METRKINEEFRKIALHLINTEAELEYIKDSSVRIVFLDSDLPKKADKEKLVLGECEKIQSKNQWAINYDFSITIYEPNIYGMSKKQIEILLFHELLHIGIDYGDHGEVYSVRKHDLEDFKIIIDRFGTEWSDHE